MPVSLLIEFVIEAFVQTKATLKVHLLNWVYLNNGRPRVIPRILIRVSRVPLPAYRKDLGPLSKSDLSINLANGSSVYKTDVQNHSLINTELT